MIKLRNLIAEEWNERNKTKDELFTTYFVSLIVKFKKRINKNEIVERIRGIKNVTIVEVHQPPKMVEWSRKSKEYEYNQIDIKFNTNIETSKEIERIKFAMLKSDNKNDIHFIDGIVAVKPIDGSLEKLD